MKILCSVNIKFKKLLYNTKYIYNFSFFLIINAFFRYIGEIKTERRKPFELQYSHPPVTQNPIITVTEHTPIPSPDFMKTRQVTIQNF